MPVAGPRFERPPSDLVDVVRAATGVDVSGARIDRSDEVTERAASIGALAFTADDTVHLPNELGPHDEGATRAVLAHELTHVAQQRLAGGVVPGEHTPEGIELEHRARAVQRAVDRRAPVVPSFLRTAPERTPTGTQRLAPSDDDYDWQERGAPPSRRGARGAFGFGFMQSTPDSAEGRGLAVADRQWAETFEAEHAVTLQGRRDERYAEMVADAERELTVQNLREEREGEDRLELQRRDILALRRRLDTEMPWEFGPPSTLDRLYPAEPELPAEEARPVRDTSRRDPAPASPPDGASSSGASITGTGATPAGAIAAAVPDAATIGRESVARRTSPMLRHRAVSAGSAASAEPDISWQQRPSTTRQQIGAVFGGVLGQLLGGSVSDGDDEAERRRAEAEPAIMQRRHARERELRHVALRSLAIAARRNETAGPSTLDGPAIAEIRATVDAEMPLEFVLPEYLDSSEDVRIDADGTIGPSLDESEPGDAAAEQPVDPTGAAAGAAGNATAPAAASPGDGVDRSSIAPTPEIVEAPAGTESPSVADPASSGRSPALAAGTAGALALGALASQVGTDEPDDEALAGRVFDAASELDLEKLSRRLYGRFRRDLRRELLIDRERAGTLADAC